MSKSASAVEFILREAQWKDSVLILPGKVRVRKECGISERTAENLLIEVRQGKHGKVGRVVSTSVRGGVSERQAQRDASVIVASVTRIKEKPVAYQQRVVLSRTRLLTGY
jgi:hypothetical protein